MPLWTRQKIYLLMIKTRSIQGIANEKSKCCPCDLKHVERHEKVEYSSRRL